MHCSHCGHSLSSCRCDHPDFQAEIEDEGAVLHLSAATASWNWSSTMQASGCYYWREDEWVDLTT